MGAVLGHTIEARRVSDDAPFTIHVADIFAPAKGQPWHPESVTALDRLVRGKRALLRIYQSIAPPDDMPEVGITVVGRIYVGGKDLSWELVRGGNAWVWEGESNDLELMRVEEWARSHRQALWALPESERIPPWEFMRRKLESRALQNK